MVTWTNLDKLASYQELANAEIVNLAEVMTGENGAERVKKYNVPMGADLVYNFASKKVDDATIEILAKLADEAELVDKFEVLYNGEVVNTLRKFPAEEKAYMAQYDEWKIR